MQKVWKLGLREVARSGDVPANATPDICWQLAAGGALLTDPFSRRDALDLFRALGGYVASNQDLTNRDLLNQVVHRINDALSRRQIVALRRHGYCGPSTVDNTVPATSPSKNGAGAENGSNGAKPAKEKTWVDVQLVDQEGEPVPGAHYKLKVTDGSVREGNLDDSGRVRVNNIDPGSCQVWFPDYDGSEWARLS